MIGFNPLKSLLRWNKDTAVFPTKASYFAEYRRQLKKRGASQDMIRAWTRDADEAYHAAFSEYMVQGLSREDAHQKTLCSLEPPAERARKECINPLGAVCLANPWLLALVIWPLAEMYLTWCVYMVFGPSGVLSIYSTIVSAIVYVASVEESRVLSDLSPYLALWPAERYLRWGHAQLGALIALLLLRRSRQSDIRLVLLPNGWFFRSLFQFSFAVVMKWWTWGVWVPVGSIILGPLIDLFTPRDPFHHFLSLQFVMFGEGFLVVYLMAKAIESSPLCNPGCAVLLRIKTVLDRLPVG